MNFMQQTPFLRLWLALAAGISLYQFFQIPEISLIAFCIVALVLIVFSFLTKSSDNIHKNRWIFGLGTFLLLTMLGFFLCRTFERKNEFSALGEKSIFQVKLISAPIEKANSYQCKVQLTQKFDSLQSLPSRGNAMIYLPKDSAVKSLRYGDKLLVGTEFKSPDGVQNPDGFDYARYLKRQGVLGTAYVSSENWRKSEEQPQISLRRISDGFRNKLLDIYREFGISGGEFAVLAALTLGYTDELDTVVIKSYSATGAMHILSVSGLHVGIIFVVLNFLLKSLNKSRRKKAVKAAAIIAFLWIYAFITGLSPSVTRAALMFSFVAMGNSLERKPQIYNTIFMSAFIMLLFAPNALFNIGFQLSYSAVLSIVFFQPKISKLFDPKNKIVKWAWDLVAVSVAAQLGTAPFTLYYFHQFPNYFLITNLVAIPISTLVIYLAIALLIFFKIPLLSTAIAFLLKWSLWLMNFLIVQIQELPLSVSYLSLDYKQLILTFIALFLLVAYFYTKKIAVLTAGLFAFLLVTTSFLFKKHNALTESKMIVFSDSRTPIVNFIRCGKNYVFTTDSVRAERVADSFWKSNLLETPIYLSENKWFTDGFAFFEGKRILILTDNFLKNKTSENPIAVDYLIIANKVKPRMEQIIGCVQPKNVIVDKSISAWYTNHVKETCATHKIGFYSVAEKGAYIVRF